MTDYQLWHGDCLEEIDRIESGSVDAIICDLPYNVTNCHWDILIPFEPLWKQYKRVIKKNGAVVLFGRQPFTSLLVMSNLEWFKCEWIWEKSRASNFANADYSPMKYHESIIVFGKGQISYFPMMEDGPKYYTRVNTTRKPNGIFGRNLKGVGLQREERQGRYPKSVIRIPSMRQQDLIHPTQKPVALLSYLIKTYTNEGETVLDNTFGSCSTGEAALRTGRRFIGIERDANYFEIGKARMERVAAELRGELNHLPMFREPVLSSIEGAVAV